MVAPFVIAFIAHGISRSRYVLFVREDGPLEWATVFFCVFAAIGFANTARRRRGLARLFPILLSLFCVFFAGEEISWGQRIFHLQPPTYFLVANAQQELNVHNLFREVLRTKYLLIALAALWAIALPLIARIGSTKLKALRERLGIDSPSLAHVPAALVLIGVVLWYPFTQTGEVAESTFALMLLFGAKAQSLARSGAERSAEQAVRDKQYPVLAFVIFLSTVLAITVAAIRPASDHEDVERSQDELRAIAATWRSIDNASDCGLHRRVYAWAQEEGVSLPRLEDTDATRAEYGLDPWNNAYWIRHRCSRGRERVVIYSFGADGRRDSTPRRVMGDDIGIAFTP